MDNNSFSSIDFNRIGFNCFFEALTCNYEYLNLIYLALEYNYYFFIYNQNTFIDYHYQKDPAEYLLDNDKLLFKNTDKPYSTYKNDFADYIYNLFEKTKTSTYLKFIEDLNLFSNLNEGYFNKNIPLNVYVDLFYLKKDYVKYNKNFEKSCRHLNHVITLFDYNSINKSFKVVDKNSKIKDEIDSYLVNEGFINNSFKENNNAFIIDVKEEFSNEKLLYLLINNFELALQEEIIINNNIYHINSKGVKNFIQDFDIILEIMHEKTKEYTSQYLSFPLINYRNSIKSYYYLIEKLNNIYNLEFLRRLINLIKEQKNLWEIFDLKLDKIYITNKDILKEKASLKNTLYLIEENDKYIINEMFTILKSLK